MARLSQAIDEQTPADLDIHIIADNYATHKHPEVKTWLERHPRFHMHYTPTSSSWMNLVERFFGDLTAFITEKSFASTRELADAIITFLAARNENPRRYVWKAKGEDILRKIDAARQRARRAPATSNAISETAPGDQVADLVANLVFCSPARPCCSRPSSLSAWPVRQL